jgi:hypothetical protein
VKATPFRIEVSHIWKTSTRRATLRPILSREATIPLFRPGDKPQGLVKPKSISWILRNLTPSQALRILQEFVLGRKPHAGK